MTEKPQKVKILIVEDESVNAKLLESRVKKFGYTPIGPALTGEAAIELALAENPDLVLMDIRLQGEMDGIEAVKIIKEKIQTQIIYITAHSEEEFLERAKPTIPHGYILKPFQEKELRITIEMALYVGKVDAERRKTERTLREREELLNATGIMAKVGGWELDAKTLEVSWTEQTYRIHEVPLDYKPPLEEALNFYHPDDRKKLSDAISRALEQGEPYDMEIRFITAKGNHLWTRTKCIPELVDGKVVKLKGTFQDITERKLSELALRESEKRYRQLFNNAPAGIYDIDFVQNRITSVNDVACHISGYSRDEILSMSPLDLLSDDSKNFFLNRLELISSGKSVSDSVEFEIISKSGDSIFALLSISFKHGNNQIVGASVVAHDITEKKQAEQKIKDAEKKAEGYREDLELYSKLTPLGIIIFDNDFNITSWNPGAEKIFGYTAEEAIGKNTFDILVPDYHHENVKKVHLLTDPKVTVNINDNKTKDGRIITVQWFNSPRFDNEGKLTGLIASCQDITEKNKIEQALKESENKFRSFSDNSIAGKYIIQDGLFKYVNPKFAEIFGYSVSELMDGILVADTVYNEDVDLVRSEIDKRITGEKKYSNYSFKGIKKSGEIIDVEVYGSSMNYQGKPASIGTLLDITEKKKTEEALLNSELKYRTTFESIPDIVTITQVSDGCYSYVNDTFCEITGYSKHEVIGRTPRDINLYADFEDRDQMMHELKENGKLLNYEIKFRKKDGTFFDSLFSARPIVIGNEDCLIALTKDITEQKEILREKGLLEEQLKQAQKMEAIGTLAGGIAHDFNNLLQAINGYTQLLLMEKTEDDSEYKSLSEIYKSSNRASELVRQLLLFSRKGAAVRKPLELNHEVEDARKILERTIPKMVNIEVHTGGRLWSIMADPVQIEQILLNLGTNAADAMSEGGRLVIETENITIDNDYCQNHLGAQPGNYVLLTVTDTGEGIDDETKEKVFEPFFTTKEFGKGTGLGLASVYGIVKSHGGYIMCYSEVGMGTTFKIYLPAMDEPKSEPEKRISDERPKGGSETILLVDDESSIRDFASQVLLKFGYTPLTATSGEEALEIYVTRRNDIDLVVIDLGMPGMGGHKCVQQLLKINADIKVIIASGYSISGQVKDTLEAGAKGFVGKPYQIHELLGKVRDVLDGEE